MVSSAEKNRELRVCIQDAQLPGRSVASVQTIRFSVSTSFCIAARPMFMSRQSTLTRALPHRA
jgi:hypothetical protein